MSSTTETPAETPTAAHERLVAYVHALHDDPEPRAGVWMEHSYARGGATPRPAGPVRELLAPVRPPRRPLDVTTPDPPRPAPPDPPPPLTADRDPEPDDWEANMPDAPDLPARRLAARVLGLLRALRLARLAGAGGQRDEAQAAARRLRRALAPLWPGGSPQWLATVWAPRLPRRWRALFDEMVRELRRSIPRLAARLGPGPAAPEPAPKPGPAVMPLPERPLLVWVGCGCERTDARWERRLRALVPTHYLRMPVLEPCGVEAWCSAVAAAAKAALGALDASEAGALVLGGAGAGASLARLLCASEPRARALLLLAPPLLTAEGWRSETSERRVPTLVVAGGTAAGAWRGAAKRLLLVSGADEQLRLGARARRRLRLPQHALDAAVADEAARWLSDAVDAAGDDSETPAEPDPPPRSIEIVEGRVMRASAAVPLALLPPARRRPVLLRGPVRLLRAPPADR